MSRDTSLVRLLQTDVIRLAVLTPFADEFDRWLIASCNSPRIATRLARLNQEKLMADSTAVKLAPLRHEGPGGLRCVVVTASCVAV
jgi:hypothetical protein